MTQESLPFSISLDLALDGAGSPATQSYQAALAKADAALDWLKKSAADKSLELLGIPARTDDLAAARKVAAKLATDTTDIVVFGIGGSSLGGEALTDLLPFGSAHRPRVHFCANPDPFTLGDVLGHVDLKTTRFVAISKSGGTAETLLQTLAAADAIEKAGGGKWLKDHFAIITEPHDSALRKFAQSIGAPVLDHPTGVGGRYSVLTMVGVLPALLMGLDVDALRVGAQQTLDAALAAKSAKDCAPATGAALHHALASDGKLHETILWCYADRLKTFGPWWRQLWAESLGKDGKGSTPVAALGPVDQHSQLQLYLGGPADKLYTLVSTGTDGEGPAAPAARAKELGLDYLAGRHAGDLVAAEVRATAETLHKNGRPVRRMHVPKVDERSMGALMMHFMLETMLMGKLMGVDPFNQPAVEEGKILARKYLEESGK